MAYMWPIECDYFVFETFLSLQGSLVVWSVEEVTVIDAKLSCICAKTPYRNSFHIVLRLLVVTLSMLFN